MLSNLQLPQSRLPAPFDRIVNSDELYLANAAHHVRVLAVAAYGTDVDYQASAAWKAVCGALESHRAQRSGWATANDELYQLKARMSEALGLSREADDGVVTHETDADELVAEAEFYYGQYHD